MTSPTLPPLPEKKVSPLLKAYVPMTAEPHEGYNKGYFQHEGVTYIADACKINYTWTVSIGRVLTAEEREENWKKGISGIDRRTIAHAALPNHTTRPYAFKALDKMFTVLKEANCFAPDALIFHDMPAAIAAKSAAIASVPPKKPKEKRHRQTMREALARYYNQ